MRPPSDRPSAVQAVLPHAVSAALVLLGCTADDAEADDAPSPAAEARGGAGGDASASGAATSAGGASASGTGASTAATGGAGAAAPSPCDHYPRATSGTEARTMLHAGDERSYLLHLPPAYETATDPLPVVLSFHGFGASAEGQENTTELSETSDAKGFVLVHPEGTGWPKAWNGGDCCGVFNDTDDVAFVDALLDELSTQLCVDDRRVYATGFSNGAFMAHRLGCELSDRIAAIAPVAGVVGIDDCNPNRAVPVMHFHGTFDFMIPYDGGGPTDTISVSDSLAIWRDQNGCAPASQVTFDHGDTLCTTWSDCEQQSRVTHCRVDAGGHTWPGGNVDFKGGKTTFDILANEAMWDFFQQHSLP